MKKKKKKRKKKMRIKGQLLSLKLMGVILSKLRTTLKRKIF